jgi:CHAT domain-containing protein/Tfp pilus assembly protein PilF
LAQFEKNVSSEWFWKFRLLKAEVLLTQGNAAEGAELLKEPVSALPDSPELRCRLLLDQGLAAYWLSYYPESKRLFDQSLQLAKSHNLQPLIAEIEFRRAATLNRLGDAAGSEADLHDALERARQSKDTYIEATVLGNLGFLRMSAARYDEAISWFGQSLVLFDQFQAKVSTARVLNNLGQCYTQLGQPEKATALFQRAAQLAAESGDITDRYLSLGRLAEWYEGNGDYKKAFSFYRQAIDAARQAHSAYWTAKWVYTIAAASIATGDLAHAEDYNRQAIELEAKVGNPVEALLPQINVARIAEAQQQPSAAERTYRSVIRAAQKLQATEAPGVMLEARGRLANLLVRTHRNGEAETEFRLALDLINTRRSALSHYEYRISYLSSLVQFYQDYVDFLVGQHRSLEALRVAESSRARVLAEMLGGKGPVINSVDSDDYRKLARVSKNILLSYWLAPARSILWVITPSRIATFALPPEAEISALVDAYAGTIEGLHDPIGERGDAGQKLYGTLVAPARPLIPSGSNVAVVLDGALHHLDLGTLPAAGAEPHYWIDDVTLSEVPSLDLLYRNLGRHPSRTDSLLLIGDPLPPDQRSFPKLLNASLEVRGIEAHFSQSVVRTGADADPLAYAESRPEQFSVIHFTAHAEANYQDPLDSAIILSPRGDTYKLYARDVVGLPIHANLVTVSACRSAGSRTYAGEGLVGFAWAFLEAGAQNVIAGLWEVDDASTAKLMEGMYAQLRSGASPAQALRTAKLAMLHSAGPYRKPYYWAPFQVITDSISGVR